MTWTDLLALTITLAALATYVNRRFLNQPPTIALMAMAIAGSLVVLGLLRWTPLDTGSVVSLVGAIDFRAVLLDGILPFLLFAGALHVDLRRLRDQRLAIILLATVGVLLATIACGALVYAAARLLGANFTFMQALLFGALIAPTDPIAVIGILRSAKAPESLEALMSGESLVNDGVGVVLFVTLSGIVVAGTPVSALHIAGTFALEAAGGIAFGLLVGWLGYLMLRSVDDYPVEIFVTLAIAAGGYAAANALHMSGPLAIVAAGLVIASVGRRHGMSEVTRGKLDTFWEIVDEMLNAILFMLVGLEILVVALDYRHLELAAAAILAVLASRWVSVAAVLGVAGGRRRFESGTVAILTWGGLRGGISIALVLSLPSGELRSTLLTMTYAVVVFSMLAQGLTLKRLVRARVSS
ncbi:MAG: sodium:proton antiporter [Usitatibacter sp.]